MRKIIRKYKVLTIRIIESRAVIRVKARTGLEMEVEAVIDDDFELINKLEVVPESLAEQISTLELASKIKGSKAVYPAFINVARVALEIGKEVTLEIWSKEMYNFTDTIFVRTCIITEEKILEVKESPRILLKDITSTKLSYVSLSAGFNRFAHIQNDGFLLYCALTGEGKTYFAIDNLRNLQKQFERVVILAYEITAGDYLNRLSKHFKLSHEEVKREFGNIIIDTTKSFQAIEAEYDRGVKTAFIVDNIDNLPLDHDGEAFYQSKWLKDFDYFLKKNGYFAIVLSQMKKSDNRIKKEDLTVYDVAGSKDRVDMARSVIFTYYDEKLSRYNYKPLKIGSMERPDEVDFWWER